MTEIRVKIVKDTVSHRIPIGSIVRIKSEAEPRKGKKCYNILDYSCYVSEADIEVLSGEIKESERPILLNEQPSKSYNAIGKTPSKKEKEMNEWFDAYSERILNDDSPKKGVTVTDRTKLKKGDRVWAKNVICLAPNGMQSKSKDGVYVVIQITNQKYWMRSPDSDDLNEYYSKIDDVTINKLSDNKSSPMQQKKPRSPYTHNTSTMEDKIDMDFDALFKM